MVKIIRDIINIGKFSEEEYDILNEKEKSTLDDILMYSKLDPQMYTHKKLNNEIINNDIEKFNVLKGEILIGNDNPQILKDLRLVILRLQKYDIIDPKVLNNLLLQILYLI